MSDLGNPYYDIEQYERVMLKPEQMNSDILLNLKINLREKVEHKCNKNGYIDQVYKILQYKDGLLTAENLSGGAVYPVKYHCRIYAPLENTKILGEVTLINRDLIVAINGPIRIFILRNEINSSVFDVVNDYQLKDKKGKLKLNDKVVITIKNRRINPGDKTIKCMGYLCDIASESQIKKYYNVESEDNVPDNFIM